LGWYESVQDAASQIIKFGTTYYPNSEAVVNYSQVYAIYRKVYAATKEVSHELMAYRRQLK